MTTLTVHFRKASDWNRSLQELKVNSLTELLDLDPNNDGLIIRKEMMDSMPVLEVTLYDDWVE